MNICSLSDAHATLLAAHLCVNGDVTALPALRTQFPKALKLDLLLAIILTLLPESTSPSRYTSVLQALSDGNVPAPLSELDLDLSPVEQLSPAAAKKRARRLQLLPLRYPGLHEGDEPSGSLPQFLVHRAHRIDTETGLQPLILELLQPFLHVSDSIRRLAVSIVLPLLRFNYEYHPDQNETLSLELIESLDSGSAVNLLLSKVERLEAGGDAAQDLRGLVGPWMYGHAKSKRRKLSLQTGSKVGGEESCGWQDVNEWLLSLSMRDFTLLVEAINGWNGPEDVDLGGLGEEDGQFSDEEQNRLRQRYGQAGLAAIYAISSTHTDTSSDSCRILSKVGSLFGYHIHSSSYEGDIPPVTFDSPSFPSASRASLSHNDLLEPSNSFTLPTPESVEFLDAILLSIRALNDLGHRISPREGAEACLFANEEFQLFEFHAVLETMTRQSKNWRLARQQLLWLKDWNGAQSSERDISKPKGLFWRIHADRFEREILKAMLTAKQYQLAVELYASAADPPLSREQVESAVTETIFVAYDNASNGNKTRGGIKKAADILEAFSPYFSESVSFRQIKALISATHALSFYSLTLQHGVPFQPVSIRVHHDPLSLIEKVLDQNAKAYTQLDNLRAIARNLVAAGLPCKLGENKTNNSSEASIPQEQASSVAERRVTSFTVSSALQADDFDTAYSYILANLTPSSLISTPPTSDAATHEDQISWRAAYNAGKYRSASPNQAARPLHVQISHLSRRMELLSFSLLLSPSPEFLPEILAAWRRCDEEMSVLQARESEEAEEWDSRGDETGMSSSTSRMSAPGGFGPSDRELDDLETAEKRARRSHAARVRKKTAYEEAPVGLFDAARGAAKALSRNAFPLHGDGATGGPTSRPANSSNSGPGEERRSGSFDADGEIMDESGRVRKRDMVSNMVTGGLATGIGWVLGAQPTTNTGREGNA